MNACVRFDNVLIAGYISNELSILGVKSEN